MPGVEFAQDNGSSQTPAFSSLRFNDQGQLAFLAALDNFEFVHPDQELSVWLDDPELGLNLVAKRGDRAPGTDEGHSFDGILLQSPSALRQPYGFQNLSLSDSGGVVFEAVVNKQIVGSVSFTVIAEGVWRGKATEGLTPLALYSGSSFLPRASGDVPGDSPRATDVRYYRTTDQGRLVYISRSREGEESGPITLFRESSSGSDEAIVQFGEGAPGRAGLGTFGSDFQSRFLDAYAVAPRSGVTAFAAYLDPSPRFPFSRTGVWSEEEDGSLRLVAVEGDRPPGIEEGRAYAPNESFSGRNGTFESLVVDSKGQVAFLGNVGVEGLALSPTRPGIWSEVMGQGLELVAMAGQPVPGTPGLFFKHFEGLTMNADGQVAFFVDYASTDDARPFAGSSTHGIWAQDIYGELQLIAQTGMLLDVSDDPLIEDYKTISGVGSRQFQFDEITPGLNDRGEVAFWAQFTDGTSGIFVSRLVAIPEPGTVCLLFCGLLTVPQSRR